VKSILGMDTTDDEKQTADAINLQNELKDMIDDLDAESLRKLKESLKDDQ